MFGPRYSLMESIVAVVGGVSVDDRGEHIFDRARILFEVQRLGNLFDLRFNRFNLRRLFDINLVVRRLDLSGPAILPR